MNLLLSPARGFFLLAAAATLAATIFCQQVSAFSVSSTSTTTTSASSASSFSTSTPSRSSSSSSTSATRSTTSTSRTQLKLAFDTVNISNGNPGTGKQLVNLDETVQRDVYGMVSWCDNCGVQKSDGFDLKTGDAQDYFAVTNTPIQQGSPVLFIPSEMILSSSKANMEFGSLISQTQAIQILNESSDNNMSNNHLMPLFLLFVKILMEYQNGQDSPYYSWLNSLPRLYNTGASMTFACFDCLPEYASALAMQERKQSVTFQKAVKFLDQLIQPNVLKDVDALKWAYNVAVTRSIDLGNGGERYIAPMADMFNHGSVETEVQVSLDENGNCMVYAIRDIPAGSPLRYSYGDPTNPSPLFATYGFLDEESPATFCKVMNLQSEMEELGYDFSRLLFYKDTGDISMEVYDVILYDILKKNDPSLAQGFYTSVVQNDIQTKQQYHEQYFAYTKEALQKHVTDFLTKIDKFARKANGYNPTTHPRVPIILKHNSFVKQTFEKVQQNLNNM